MAQHALKAISQGFLLLSLVHHLALAVIAVTFWMRRRSMERVIDVYFASAFGTASFALATHAETRLAAAVAAALAVVWLSDAVRVRNDMSFRRTPRLRLVLMGAIGIFGFGYPGYSGELPTFLFSPLGVILPPTLLVSTAVLNAAAPATNRVLHWALAATGAVVGVAGLFVEGWIHVPLVAASLYAVPLLLGKGRLAESRDAPRETSVRQIRDRMYSRKTLLPGPRDPRRRRPLVRRRRR